jgi:hypothetical protein
MAYALKWEQLYSGCGNNASLLSKLVFISSDMEMRERGENEQIISFVMLTICVYVLVLNGDNNETKKKLYFVIQYHIEMRLAL